jgi:hypothetical protein
MRELLTSTLIDIWERGSVKPLTERALTVLAAACPDLETDTLAGLSIGGRDGLLLSVRESTFGSRVEAITSCPECGEQLELDFDLDDLRVRAAPPPAGSATLAVDEYDLSFRLPNSRDLMIASAGAERSSIRTALLERCLLSARRQDQVVPAEQLPEPVVARLEEEMMALDGQANVQVELQCPACRRGWLAAFDILSFFWNELDAWAQRVLLEVHTLASAYGWREKDILEMSAVRRNLYLELASG